MGAVLRPRIKDETVPWSISFDGNQGCASAEGGDVVGRQGLICAYDDRREVFTLPKVL